nr:cupin domain-containing protein [Sporosarcina sp. NCCP-2716]
MGVCVSPVASSSHDDGKQPYVFNIHEAARNNATYRTAVWTGDHLQVTLMSIPPGDDVGLEIHPDTDQFLRIEEGRGLVQMGNSAGQLSYQQEAGPGSAILIPAGTWHNVTNIGSGPMRLYSIYAPPHHPFGTIERTKADAD